MYFYLYNKKALKVILGFRWQGIFWAVFCTCGLAVVTQDWNEVGLVA
jgi:hypothetical protein